MSPYLRPLIGCALLVAAACSTTPVGRQDLLGFLADGVTHKEAVYTRLGTPSSQFEDARILTYRVGRNDGGYFMAGRQSDDWSTGRYSLVLIFDAGGVLTRHSLVDVRPK